MQRAAIDLGTGDPRQPRHGRGEKSKASAPALWSPQGPETLGAPIALALPRCCPDSHSRSIQVAIPRAISRKAVNDVWLEVGYGAGEHLLWQTAANPTVGFIGAEPYISGTAKLLSRLDEKQLPNLRLYEDDARDIIDALPDACIGRFFILFPDPWPKTRHHKRRFLQNDMLDAIARVLKPGAELRFATDDPGYLAYALERLMAHPAFRWTADGSVRLEDTARRLAADPL